MPGYIAKKLCPHLIFVKPDFTKYSTASRKVMAILERYGRSSLG
jgi:DNA polymerase kappa